MRNIDAHNAIVKLTEKEGWVDDPAIVKQVQCLSKSLSSNRRAPINYKDIKGIIVSYPNGVEKKYSSLQSCSINEEVFIGSIQRYIRMNTPRADGRRFRLA
ncbi:hypothetical protein NGF69_16710 [Enterococcus casseliflavus]|nr:hypothetical protein [Enterococcus casseliflavus]